MGARLDAIPVIGVVQTNLGREAEIEAVAGQARYGAGGVLKDSIIDVVPARDTKDVRSIFHCQRLCSGSLIKPFGKGATVLLEVSISDHLSEAPRLQKPATFKL